MIDQTQLYPSSISPLGLFYYMLLDDHEASLDNFSILEKITISKVTIEGIFVNITS